MANKFSHSVDRCCRMLILYSVLQLWHNNIFDIKLSTLYVPIYLTPLVLTRLEWARWQPGTAGERG